MIDQSSIYSLLRLLIFVVSLSIGLFVLLKNTKSPVNRSFFLLSLAIALRDGSYYIMSRISEPYYLLLWSKIGYGGVVFTTSATYHFIISFLNMDRRKFLYLFYTLSAVFAIIVINTNFLIVGFKKFTWGYYPQVDPVFHNVFLAMWSIPFLMSLSYLYREYKKAQSPINKKRILYFLVTMPIAYLGVIDYLPNYGIEMFPFGIIPVMFFVFPTTYAILRYRLLDIEIVIKKISLMTVGFVGSLAIIYILSYLVGPYFSTLLGADRVLFPIIVSILVSLGLFKFINFVRHIEEDELSKKFVYRPLLKKEAERISNVRTLNELLVYVVRDISHIVRLDYVAVFLWNNQQKAFVLTKSLNRKKESSKTPLGTSLQEHDPLIKALLTERKPLICGEIEYYLHSKSIPSEEWESFFRVVRQMKKIGSEISIPCFCEERLLAIINIGHKLDPNQIITNEDIEVFSSLSNNIARAIYGYMLKDEKVQLIVASQNVLISAIEAKDIYTRGHTERVAHYCALLGKKIESKTRIFTNGLSDLTWAALLHDVGKISIPDAILFKKTTLSAEEWEKIREHPSNGLKIISPVKEWLGEDICTAILHHHENYDGSGYPDHQKGKEIHFYARILRVADAFDAMTSHRPYRKTFTKEEGIDELKRYQAIQFDPYIVDIMVELFNEKELQ